MARQGDRLRADRVAELANEFGFTQAGLAAAVTRAGGKLSQQQAQAVLAGTVKRPGCLPELARVLLTTTDYLLGKTDDRNRPMRQTGDDVSIRNSQLMRAESSGIIPVWHTAPLGNGKLGELLIRERHIDSISRPTKLSGATEALAFVVQDDTMDPALRKGDIAYVNPARPALRHEDCLLIRQVSQERAAEREYVCLPRHLLRDDTASWHVRQFNPRKDYSLPKADWPEAWKIEGKISR